MNLIRPPLRDFKVPAESISWRIESLPRDHRGYPIPYFVLRTKDYVEGNPVDFRVVDPDRQHRAVRHGLCWVCGGRLGGNKAFVGGPLSTAQRLYTDHPSHRECAQFAILACPFLAIPSAQRRDADLPAHIKLENQIDANPEVTGLLIAKGLTVLPDGSLRAEGVREIIWFTRGRLATRMEVERAIILAGERDEVVTHPNKKSILAQLKALPLPDEEIGATG